VDVTPAQLDPALRAEAPPRFGARKPAPPGSSDALNAPLPHRSGWLSTAWLFRGPWLHWTCLILLTLVAGAMRLIRYDHPPLWGDEALVYSRVTGSYGELLYILRNSDGFMPLHYSLYWLLGQFYRLDPFMMRLPVALMGTLMVPAMYLLARQVSDRRTALLVAAFAACSAWLMNYSRDTKMYTPLWLFVTLNLGCLMWWLNSKRRIAYWSWIAAGAAAVGIHSPALILLPLQPLLLLTQRRLHWKHGLMMLAGIGLIGVGPAIYYTQFSRFIERTGGPVPGAVVNEDGAVDGNWGQAGLSWIEQRTRGRTPTDMVLDTSTAYLLGYEWPFDAAVQDEIVPHTLTAARIVTAVMMLLLAMALFPWPRQWRSRSLDESQEQAWWQRGLWVIALLVLPVYGFFYPRSYQDSSSPLDWLGVVNESLQGHWLVALGGAAGLAVALQLWRPRMWQWMTVVAFPLLGVVLAHAAISFVLAEEVREWTAFLLHPLVLIAAVMIGGAMAWYGSGDDFRTRMIRLGQFAVMVGLLLVICLALHQVWSHMAGQARAAGQNWISVWMTRYTGIIWPAVGLAAAMLIMRLPTMPVRIFAMVVLLGANAVNGLALVLADTEPPMDRVAADLWRGVSSEPGTLTFVERGPEGGAPAEGWILSMSGRYYLAMEMGDAMEWRVPPHRGLGETEPRTVRGDPPPRVIRSNQFFEQFNARFNAQRFLTIHPRQVRSAVASERDTQRVIIWERKRHGQEVVDYTEVEDPILRELQRLEGPSWELAGDEVMRVRVFVGSQRFGAWRDNGYARRREYVRADEQG
jgi:hypothetical protein